MVELKKLEREIHQLTEIIRADLNALRSSGTPDEVKAVLQHAIEARYAQLNRLKARLGFLKSKSR